MTLEKVIVIDKIEVLEDGQMQIRQASRFKEDGKQQAETYHRYCLAPGQNISQQPDKIKAIAAVVWTDKVIIEHNAAQAQKQ